MGAKVPVTARGTGQAIFKCPESGLARADNSHYRRNPLIRIFPSIQYIPNFILYAIKKASDALKDFEKDKERRIWAYAPLTAALASVATSHVSA
eukprot:6199632-Pleurochrysis_carterae.AAC.2